MQKLLEGREGGRACDPDQVPAAPRDERKGRRVERKVRGRRTGAAGTGSPREGGRRGEGKEARRRQGARQPGFAALVVVAQSTGYSNN